MSRFKLTIAALTGLCTTLFATAVTASPELNLYSARKEALIQPLLENFTAETGIKVNLVTGKADALLKRLKSEGRNSPADLLLTTDAGRLYRAKAAEVTQPFNSDLLNSVVPASYRDPENHWVGLSVRSRPILYVKGKVNPNELSTYEALADDKWKRRICIRSSSNIYNQSLIASMIVANGEAKTETWVKGLMANLARPPKGGDRDQIKAAAAGQCDIAIANTYYLAGMLNSDKEDEKSAAMRMGVFWPNQSGRGAHVNISGAALTRYSQNPENAIRLIEFLASENAQQWYAERNGEYPVRAGVAIGDTLKAWGEFKADRLNLGRLGELNSPAVMLMDRAGWK